MNLHQQPMTINRPEGANEIDAQPDVLTIFPSNLYGAVTVSGAKNSALRLLAASLLTSDEVVITNYPSTILDARIHVDMLRALGKDCTVDETQIVIRESGPPSSELKWQGRSIRNTLLILGALVARTGLGCVPHPGGCQIGNSDQGRQYDLHVMLLERLGARVVDDGNVLIAEAKDGLKGTDIELPIRSTGATENAIIAATLARGVTRIWNPHVRPEVFDLVNFLRGAGAKIEVYGQERIEVSGQPELHGVSHRVIPDNVEALTWLIAAVLTGGEIEIHDFPFRHLEVPLIFLRESGARMFAGEDSLVVRGGRCFPVELSTGPYPGINSDMQPLFAVYGAQAKGESRLIDLRFPGRYAYAAELGKLGVDYKIEGNLLRIQGGNPLKGTAVQALDLRAGAALALSGLVANGPTHVHDAWQIDRGYTNFRQKAKSLGVRLSNE